jgi:hypothetical protein
MTVTAKSADPYLLIAAKDPTAQGFANSDWVTELTTAGSSANWAIQTQATINNEDPADAKLKLIAPKTIGNGNDMTWVWNSSNDPDDANTTAVTANSNKAVTLTEAAANKNAYRSSILTGTVAGVTPSLEDAFVLKQTFSFKNVSQSAVGKNLKIDSVTVSRADSSYAGDSDFNLAVRVLVINAAGEYALYNGTGQNIAAENGATGSRMGGSNNNIIIGELGLNTTTDITVYMYFDGNASQAKTNNAYDLNGVNATFAFSIDDETATTP